MPTPTVDTALGPLTRLPGLRSAIEMGRQQEIRHRLHWAEQRERDGDLTYLVMGDSAGVAIGVDDPREGYVHRLVDRLEAASGRRVRIVNIAVSGATAATVLADQVPQLPGLPRPDIVTCVVGGNDVMWPRRFRLPVFAEPFTEIARHLPPGATVGLVPSFSHWPYESRVRAANIVIRAVAERHGLQVADLFAPTKALGMGRRKYATLARDRFHPNERGYAMWAEALWPSVERQLRAAQGRDARKG